MDELRSWNRFDFEHYIKTHNDYSGLRLEKETKTTENVMWYELLRDIPENFFNSGWVVKQFWYPQTHPHPRAHWGLWILSICKYLQRTKNIFLSISVTLQIPLVAGQFNACCGRGPLTKSETKGERGRLENLLCPKDEHGRDKLIQSSEGLILPPVSL